MSLSPGTRLGPYEIRGRIGAGGMGEVFHAHDTRLGRDAAIKVLPDSVATAPDRLARFEREARTLASLNHPNIAHVYGVEVQGDTRALVMEFVAGEDLSARISRGPIPIDEAVPMAREILDALEAAHEQGIVHRDLKPANIKVRPDGGITVLDFGLAKALGPDGPHAAPDTANSPTLTAPATLAGVILGTAAYMAPEQARGRAVDKRADLWAFGVVFYEMLTGRRAFDGEDVSTTLAAVLTRDVDWSALPASTPVTLNALLRRCFERDPKLRWRDAGDVRVALTDVSKAGDPPRETTTLVPAMSMRGWMLAVLGALALAAAASVVAWQLKPAPVSTLLRKFNIAAKSLSIADAAIAPNGRLIAYLAGGRLWVQRFDTIDAQEIAGITEANRLFWSPDSGTIGFEAKGQLWKVPASGGTAAPIARVPSVFSAAGAAVWLPGDRIVFTTGGTGLMEVSALGGEPRVLLATDPKAEADFHDVSALPGGKGFLFVPHPISGTERQIELFDGTSRRVVLKTDESVGVPVYDPSGHIVYALGSGIWAVPFSLEKLERTGEPFRISPVGARPNFSADGTLAFINSSPTDENLQLAWVNDKGVLIETLTPPGRVMTWPTLSPDGQSVLAVTSDSPDESSLDVFDLVRHTSRRPVRNTTAITWPTWSPDGTFIMYTGAGQSIWSVPADGSAPPTQVSQELGSTAIFALAGRQIIFSREQPGTSADLFVAPFIAAGSAGPATGASAPLLTLPRMQYPTAIAPGERWLLYMSNEPGVWTLFLTAFPSARGQWEVGPSQFSRWNGKANRVFSLLNDTISAIDITTTPTVSVSPPRPLFTSAAANARLNPGFDVAADGTRFLVLRYASGRPGNVVTVVVNWPVEFARPGTLGAH